jgi:protein gp37
VSAKTNIEWTDATWNPIRGCSRVSAGCLNCYAEKVAARFSDKGQPFHLFASRTPKPHWTGKIEIVENHLLDPLHWRSPKRVFVNSMSDLFHESLSDEAIDRVFAVMALCPQHTFQALTKRPERMLRYCQSRAKSLSYWEAAGRSIGYTFKFQSLTGEQLSTCPFPLPNVWLGTSVEDRTTADERIPLLLRTPAAKRFVSYEPALGPVDFESIPFCLRDGHPTPSDMQGPMALQYIRHGTPGINWLIVGGESGPGARPFNVEWARNTIRQCSAAGVACFVKQLGARPLSEGGEEMHWLTDRKGGNIEEFPIDLRVREFPEAGT